MTARRWMDDGTRLFLGALADLGDDDLDRPLALPGWTGRHVVAHVHYNARALGRLVQWATTGTENRMYASPEQRASEIEAGAARPAAELRDLVRRSADDLASALDGLPAGAWDATVVTAQGRTVPATEIPWMRAREVCVHAVDLGAGITFCDLPADFTAALLANVVRKRAGPAKDRSSRPGLPAGYRPRPSWPPGYEPNGFGGRPMPVLDVPGTALYYDSAGDGLPLILVHGSAVDGSTWDGVLPDLARDRRVITYDRRGYWRSTHKPGKAIASRGPTGPVPPTGAHSSSGRWRGWTARCTPRSRRAITRSRC